MKKISQQFSLTALASAMLASFGFSSAYANDLAEFTAPDSKVSIGAGNWSHERHQQGIYDGMRDNLGYFNADIDFNWLNKESGTWVTAKGRNLGLENYEVRGEYLVQGNFGLSLENSSTPRYNPFTFNTGLRGIGTTNQTVGGAAANALPRRNIDLETRRDMTQLGVYKSLMENVDLNISFKNEEKEGNRAWGRRVSNGQGPQFVVEPINSTTRQMDAALSYSGEKLQLQGGYYGSWYENHHAILKTQTNATAATTMYISLPPSNQAHQLYLNGGMELGSSTRSTFKLSFTEATQNDRIPAAGVSPSIVAALAPTHVEGKVNTSLVQLGLSSRPTKELSVVASARYEDIDDKTPVRVFVPAATPDMHNTPHSSTTAIGKIEATYRLPLQLNATAGIDYSDKQRSHPSFANERYVPYRTNVEETTYRLQLRRSLGEELNGSIGYSRSEREGGRYETAAGADAGGAAYQDKINPIHLANRERDKWRLGLEWSPTDRISVQTVYEASEDEYGSHGRPYGVMDGSSSLFSIDASYALSDNWQINTWFSRDESVANQVNGTNLAVNRISKLEDTGDSFGLGVKGELTSRVKLGGDSQWTVNRSKYPVRLIGTAFTGDNQQAPDIKNESLRISLFADYSLDKASSIRFDMIHEQWETNDWSWTLLNGNAWAYGNGGTDGTTVSAKNKQESNFVGMRYTYRFQ